MVAVVLGLCFAMPLKESGIIMYVQMVCYAGVGALVFLFVSIRNSLLVDVLGERMIERVTGNIKAVLRRLHLIK